MKTYLVIVADIHQLDFTEERIAAENPVDALLDHESIGDFYDTEEHVSRDLADYPKEVMQTVYDFWTEYDLCVRVFEVE